MIKLRIILAVLALIPLVTNAASKEINKNKFQNVLLIVNFNHPYYKNIEFIKKLYSPYFKKIVFYGTKPHEEVTCFATDEGRLICEVLYDALDRNPGHDGYLFLEDDCVLNMWNCFELDLNKIWILTMYTPDSVQKGYKMHPRGYTWANLVTGASEESWAWGQPIGLEATRIAFTHLLPKDITFITNNVGKDYAIAVVSDMFYFPGKYRDDVMRMCPCFKNVFIEIAMPTLLACLDDKNRWESVSVMWGITDSQLHAQWPMQYSCVHPVKLSSDSNRALLLQTFANAGIRVN